MLLARRLAAFSALAGVGAGRSAVSGRAQAQLCTATATQPLTIHQFPCLSDNYGYLVHDAESGITAAIDTPEVAPILAALEQHGWSLTHILNTHHHDDHAGGNLELKQRTGCTIIGPAEDGRPIPGLDRAVRGGDSFELGPHRLDVIDVGDEILLVVDKLIGVGIG